MAFTHRFAIDGTEACGRRHDTVAQALECQDDIWAEEAEASLVYCSLCDGIGHGQPGYGPCPLEERPFRTHAPVSAAPPTAVRSPLTQASSST